MLNIHNNVNFFIYLGDIMIDDQKNDIKLIRKSTSSKKGEINKSLEDVSQESHLYFL